MARKIMQPDDVFTPRSATVNEAMYVSRDELETALFDAISGSRNIVIHGESGCGKSWLFKRVFHRNKIPYMTVNMANANRFGSLDDALSDRFAKFKKEIVSSIQSKGKIGAKIGLGTFGVNGSAELIDTIEKLHPEPFERCLGIVSSGNKKSFIVFENIEGILHSDKILNQITSVITLLDDEDYAQYGVRIVLIGVPDDLQRYFLKSKFSQTISNRLVEIPEVERLTAKEAESLVRRGFVDLLRYKIVNSQVEKTDRFGTVTSIKTMDIIKNISWQCDHIPQYLHELCLEIANASKTSKVVNERVYWEGVYKWIRTSFTADYGVVESKLNSIETKVGRRNQAIYALGQMGGIDFKSGDVEKMIRSEFPVSTRGVKLNVPQTLSDLAVGERPLIRKTPRGNAYRFTSPKLKICVRCMLRKVEDESIEKRPIEKTFTPMGE